MAAAVVVPSAALTCVAPAALQVKHRLGSSTVELFFLSALLPTVVIEHMPPSLFVTDLVQRNRSEH